MSKVTATPAMRDAHADVSNIRSEIADLKRKEQRILGQVRSAMELMGVDNIVNDGDKSLFRLDEVNRTTFNAEGFDEAYPSIRAPFIETEPHTRFIVGRVHKDDAEDHDSEAALEAEAEARAS